MRLVTFPLASSALLSAYECPTQEVGFLILKQKQTSYVYTEPIAPDSPISLISEEYDRVVGIFWHEKTDGGSIAHDEGICFRNLHQYEYSLGHPQTEI
jgi:hypothetical protein